jgi:hypothetical protein
MQREVGKRINSISGVLKMYSCPNATRKNGMQFLMCKKLMKQDENYVTVQECAKTACGFVKFCEKTRQWENSDGAKTCRILNKN